jgi:putative ABC transport system permease protein
VFATDLQIAARNLAKHTKRNALLAAAVAVVTALLVVLGGLAAGIKASMLESATTLMTGHVNVGGFYKVTSGTSAPLVSDADRVLAETRKHVPELDYVTVRGRGWAKAVSETASMDLVLAGMDISTEQGFRRVVQPVQGKLDDLAQPGTILLFEDQAKRLGVRVGDALTLSAPTARGMNNTADVRVAVVARSIGLLSAFSAFLPSATLRDLYQLKPTTTGAIHLYLKDARASSAVAARLRGELAAAGWRVMDADPRPYWEKLMNKVNNEDWTGQKLDVTTWEDEMSFMSWVLTAVQWLTGILITILLVIVVIGIMNTLAIAIRERTREIEIGRAHV